MRKFCVLAALCAAVFISGRLAGAPEDGFPIYFENSKVIVKAEVVNRVTYLPLVEIVQFLRLPFTDSQALETFTIRSGTSRLVVTRNSGLISINDQITVLRSPILRDNDRWMVPIDFLTQGMARFTATDYRYRAGAPRMFSGKVQAAELAMNAQSLGSISRLTVRVGAAAVLKVNRDDPRRTVIQIDRSPLDPLRESLEHKDRLIRSIAYDDSDGTSRIVAEITDEVADVRVTPTEGNEIFFIDFVRKAPATAPEPPAAEPAPAATPDKLSNPITTGKLRVVVLDPGHGGLDTGTKVGGLSEKDLTLAIARKLRTVLQSRLGITVLLTRDSDIAMDNEARTAVANNNQANLFISLHIGYSPNKTDSGSSVFVMKEDFGATTVPTTGRERLFLPWYLGYRSALAASVQVATALQDELTRAIPGWKFPLRRAPMGVLSSTTMPGIVLEIGNLNNSVNSQTLLDNAFQLKLVNTVVNAIQRFTE